MDQKLVDFAKNLKANGSTQDEVLRELRKVNSSMIDTIAAIRFVYDVGLGQAKDIVALSPYWNSIHQAHKRFCGYRCWVTCMNIVDLTALVYHTGRFGYL